MRNPNFLADRPRLHVAFLVLFLFLVPVSVIAGDWQGVDEAVVEKIAREHGREASRPLIDPGEGDILLFAFLVSGAAGGFAAGYYWRMLTERKTGATGNKDS